MIYEPFSCLPVELQGRKSFFQSSCFWVDWESEEISEYLGEVQVLAKIPSIGTDIDTSISKGHPYCNHMQCTHLWDSAAAITGKNSHREDNMLSHSLSKCFLKSYPLWIVKEPLN